MLLDGLRLRHVRHFEKDLVDQVRRQIGEVRWASLMSM